MPSIRMKFSKTAKNVISNFGSNCFRDMEASVLVAGSLTLMCYASIM
jgi:hypothetical protein